MAKSSPKKRSSSFARSGETEQKVGNRLRELRLQQGLSMRMLAENSGVSANTLSLIETGKTSPSVSTLQQIAVALHCPLAAFFESNVIRGPVIYTAHQKRRVKEFPNAKVEELFSGNGEERLLPFIVTFEPHQDSGPEPIIREGREFIYCLTGRIIYRINEEGYALEPGDSLVISSKLPYRWVNPTEAPCRVVIVIDRGGR